MYGLPKTHKCGMPLRPILAMTNSPYLKLARWLVVILTPLKQKFLAHFFKDSLELIDVQSLFTNVPLHETIDYIRSRRNSIPNSSDFSVSVDR
ncbi:hypothetical protein EG68_02382 [Paragonimus skrjabini miyazakii]|uniref:Reverse transcriptase domain-containing protein n=1 Tax=Paragonimus skrjabini miyazakii TaxID=59628 RepID=A0A8S9Z552_9TREM|nr:hypothetical protein EG68_02382 [Paragonimus skrjabini miyazakii]